MWARTASGEQAILRRLALDGPPATLTYVQAQDPKALLLPGHQGTAQFQLSHLGSSPLNTPMEYSLYIGGEDGFNASPALPLLAKGVIPVTLEPQRSQWVSIPFELKTGIAPPLDRSGYRRLILHIKNRSQFDDTNLPQGGPGHGKISDGLQCHQRRDTRLLPDPIQGSIS